MEKQAPNTHDFMGVGPLPRWRANILAVLLVIAAVILAVRYGLL
jgi:hypothetical protein